MDALYPYDLHKSLCFLIYEAEASLISSTEINPRNLLSAKHFEVEGRCTRCGHLKAHNVIMLLERLRGSQGQRWPQQCYIQMLILGGLRELRYTRARWVCSGSFDWAPQGLWGSRNTQGVRSDFGDSWGGIMRDWCWWAEISEGVGIWSSLRQSKQVGEKQAGIILQVKNRLGFKGKQLDRSLAAMEIHHWITSKQDHTPKQQWAQLFPTPSPNV